jgi:C-terminal processing protease CtpA/Prc
MLTSPSFFRALLVGAAIISLQGGMNPSYAEDDKDRTAGAAAEDTSVKSASDTYQQLNLFGDVFERVRAKYVDEVTDEKLIQYALTAC